MLRNIPARLGSPGRHTHRRRTLAWPWFLPVFAGLLVGCTFVGGATVAEPSVEFAGTVEVVPTEANAGG